MKPFSFYNPVKVVFGKGAVAQVGEETVRYGRKALLVYGQSSLKTSGVFGRIAASLKAAGLIEAETPKTAELRTETPATQPASEN